MKKGDIIEKETVHEVGEQIASNCDSPQSAEDFMKHEFLSHYKTESVPAYEIIQGTEKGFEIIAKSTFITKSRARVNWVIDDEAAITSLDGTASHFIVSISKDRWRVIQEAQPSYQSQVASFSDEELRASLDSLRLKRIIPVTVKTRRREPVSDIERFMESLPPEKKLELLRKLGIE